MGAWFSDTTAVGRTAGEAFSRAQDDARYEYGHGGYTGTIAEKDGYVLIDLPKGLTAERLVRLACDVEFEGTVDSWELRSAREYAATAPKGHVRSAKAALRRAEKDHAKQVKQAERFWKKLRPEVADAVRLAAEIACGDKWGPVAAVELRGAEATAAKKWHGAKRGQKVYRFFGYASS
jgi:hypothetical protein